MRNRLLPVITGIILLAVVSCNKTETPPFPQISTDQTAGFEVEYGDEDGFGYEKEMTVYSNRDWSVEENAEWITVEPSSGVVANVGEMQEFKVKVTVFANEDGNTRKSTVRFRTSAVYTDVVVKQKEHPLNAPKVLYYNGFGKGAYDSEANGGYPKMMKDPIWRVEEGPTAAIAGIKYYGETDYVDRLTIRSSGTSSSTGYAESSGGNHIHFGSNAPAFTLAELSVHERLKALTISFGILRNKYGDKNNVVNLDEFPMWISKDGSNWMKAEVSTVGAPVKDKWSLCQCSFSFDEKSFDKLYIRFKPTQPSTYRFDDLKVSKGPEGAEKIDWSKATEVIDLTKDTEMKPGEPTEQQPQ